MRKSYHSEKSFLWSRYIALGVSILVHSLVVLGLFWQVGNNAVETKSAEELEFGSSGGGGGDGVKEEALEFGPLSSALRAMLGTDSIIVAEINLIQIEFQREHVEIAQPVPEKEKPKPIKKAKKQQSIIAENLPLRHVRKGTGPGSGGNTGGGSGGGIGAGQGFAIDWGGAGGRRLLSGRLPQYPKGTDKQMAVVLQFAVLPDGSVEQIRPTRRTDELLERAAINALQSWRFDPLPSQVVQRSQIGKVTFSFKLE